MFNTSQRHGLLCLSHRHGLVCSTQARSLVSNTSHRHGLLCVPTHHTDTVSCSKHIIQTKSLVSSISHRHGLLCSTQHTDTVFCVQHITQTWSFFSPSRHTNIHVLRLIWAHIVHCSLARHTEDVLANKTMTLPWAKKKKNYRETWVSLEWLREYGKWPVGQFDNSAIRRARGMSTSNNSPLHGNSVKRLGSAWQLYAMGSQGQVYKQQCSLTQPRYVYLE